MNGKNKTILVTGSAGFIGFHLCKRLLDEGHSVVGIDNLNHYYDINLKQARLAMLQKNGSFKFYKQDITDLPAMDAVFSRDGNDAFDVVVNLAAQAGVRYSLQNPHAHINSNIVGFMNILECCRHNRISHLVFASSSSVYGMNDKVPSSVKDNVDHPVSLYAASKKANELMAHTYAHLYGLPCTGLRFFTVYGPWGRPDMAYFLFTEAIMAGRPIDVFNYGNMKRDFTYIDDIIEGVVRIMDKIPQSNPDWDKQNPDPGSSCAPYKLYNIGNNNPIQLIRLIEILEHNLGRKAQINMLPMQPGDVPITYADVDDLIREIGFKPSTTLEEGLKRFVDWFRWFYHPSNHSE